LFAVVCGPHLDVLTKKLCRHNTRGSQVRSFAECDDIDPGCVL
jgi:hypothetical protein